MNKILFQMLNKMNTIKFFLNISKDKDSKSLELHQSWLELMDNTIYKILVIYTVQCRNFLKTTSRMLNNSKIRKYILMKLWIWVNNYFLWSEEVLNLTIGDNYSVIKKSFNKNKDFRYSDFKFVYHRFFDFLFICPLITIDWQ